jgi:D-psicose/D-tagatose/L-ribulose 3-epimerase
MLLWASQITDEHFPLLAKIKAAGYDGVELPLFAASRRTRSVSAESSKI